MTLEELRSAQRERILGFAERCGARNVRVYGYSVPSRGAKTMTAAISTSWSIWTLAEVSLT